MTTNTGKTHTYCGMMLIFEDKKLKVDMSEYLADTINKFPEDCNISVTTPAALHLSKVNDNQEKLNPSKKQAFHTFVAKLLF